MANVDDLNLDDLDDDDANRVRAALNAQAANQPAHGSRVRVLNARKLQKLGFWTVICTVLNRAIGNKHSAAPSSIRGLPAALQEPASL